MCSQLDYYSLELFQIDKTQLIQTSNDLQLKKYRAHIPILARSLFKDEISCLWHLTEVLRAQNVVATVMENGGRPCLITSGDRGINSLSPYFIRNPAYSISLSNEGDAKLDISTETGFRVFRRLVWNQLRMNVKPPFQSQGCDIVDRSKTIIGPPSGNTPAIALLKHCRVYRGATTRFRKYGDSFFLQIIPQAKIELDTSLDKLISEGTLGKEVLPHLITHVQLPTGRNVRLLKILDSKAADKIKGDTIYEGRSFMEFADDNYPFLKLTNPDSPLAAVASETGPATFSLESLLASFTFSALNSLDEDFFSELVSILKLESASRLDRAVNWITEITPIEIGSSKFQTSLKPYEVAVLREEFESDLSNLDPVVSGGRFKPPPISLRIQKEKEGKSHEAEIPPDYYDSYKGTINDLFSNPQLKPLVVPQKLKVIAYVQRDLQLGWKALRKSLENGTGPQGFRGFQQTFGTELSIRVRYVDDFFSKEFYEMVDRLKDKQYSCGLVIVPRHLSTPEETRRIYTETKIRINEHGIPVQVIADDSRVTESRNDTLVGKSMNSRSCFGIALNILVKMGAIITALASSFSESLLPNAIVIGYDIIRVPVKDEEMLRSLYSARRTIPLAAPLIISDNRGSKISHRFIYRLETETSLFDGKNGEEILSEIPDFVKNVVIHKDGPLYEDEVAAIEKLFEGKKKVYPISIIRSEVPRVFNPRHKGAGFELKAGTFLALSENEYILITTPISAWKPDRQGWPCPILIRFHGKDIDDETKRKLLYQIYALTKMQIGSQRPTRLPISVHYSNMIARFIRKAGDPTPSYLRFFVGKFTEDEFIPKWYA